MAEPMRQDDPPGGGFRGPRHDVRGIPSPQSTPLRTLSHFLPQDRSHPVDLRAPRTCLHGVVSTVGESIRALNWAADTYGYCTPAEVGVSCWIAAYRAAGSKSGE